MSVCTRVCMHVCTCVCVRVSICNENARYSSNELVVMEISVCLDTGERLRLLLSSASVTKWSARPSLGNKDLAGQKKKKKKNTSLNTYTILMKSETKQSPEKQLQCVQPANQSNLLGVQTVKQAEVESSPICHVAQGHCRS